MTYKRVKSKLVQRVNDLKAGAHVVYTKSTVAPEEIRRSGIGEALGRIVEIWTEPTELEGKMYPASIDDPYYLILNFNSHNDQPVPYIHIIKDVKSDLHYKVPLEDLKIGARVLYHPSGHAGETIGIVKGIIRNVEFAGTKPRLVIASDYDPWVLIENEHTRIETPHKHECVIELLGHYIKDESHHGHNIKLGTRVYFHKNGYKSGIVKEIKYLADNSKPVYVVQTTEGVENVNSDEIKNLLLHEKMGFLTGKLFKHFNVGSTVLYHPEDFESTGIVKHLVAKPEGIENEIKDVVIENDYTREEIILPVKNVSKIIEFVETDV